MAALIGTTSKAPLMAVRRGGTLRTWLEKAILSRLGELHPEDRSHWLRPDELEDRLVDRAVGFLREAAKRLNLRATHAGGRPLPSWDVADLDDVIVLRSIKSPSPAAKRVVEVLLQGSLGLAPSARSVLRRLAALVLKIVCLLDMTPCPPRGTVLGVIRLEQFKLFPWLRKRLLFFSGLPELETSS